MPGVKQAWPKVAVCWSPATPAMGMGPPSHSGRALPITALLGAMLGSTLRGMFSSARMSSFQSCVQVEQHGARGVAGVGAVHRAAGQRHTSQVSTVPKASSPRSAIWRAPGTWSSSQDSLVPEKYASSTRPVRDCRKSACPSARSRSHSGAVRRSCQTMARQRAACGALPDQRGFALVGDADGGTSAAVAAALRSASRATSSWLCQSSPASCSTQPGRG